MNWQSLPTILGLAALWALSLHLLWPQTVLSGYAGHRSRIEVAVAEFGHHYPWMRAQCRAAAEDLIRGTARATIAAGLPTIGGYRDDLDAARADYAASNCGTGPFLVADQLGRDAANDVRSMTGLPGGR